VWEWFYDAELDLLQQRSFDNTVWAYRRCLDAERSHSVTRSQDVYARVGSLVPEHRMKGLPATVEQTDDGLTVIRSTGPQILLTEPVAEEDFWSFLSGWGGDWMWEDRHMPYGFDAVVDAVFSGKAIYVTDGSYNRPLRDDLDGAGWLIYCPTRKRVVFTCSFCETSKHAGSYRGELLGLLAIHVFLLAITDFYDLQTTSLGTIACDNLGGLNKSKERRRKVPINHKHADILRSLRRVHARLRGRMTYTHVYGHQDRRKTWNQMTLLERLNCRCDSLAKKAIHLGIQTPPDPIPSRQRLPLESAAVYYKNQKLSGECGKEIRFQAGRVAARRFYVGELGWLSATFDCVDWEARDKSISSIRICFESGYLNSLLRSAPVGRIWGDGSALKSHVALIALNPTKTPHICFIAPILADSPCFEKSSAISTTGWLSLIPNLPSPTPCHTMSSIAGR
jgi:hypothetical protein